MFFPIAAAYLVLAQQYQGSSRAIEDASYIRTLQTAYLYQDNPRFGKDGAMYCGPASAAMGFSWLARAGYPRLLPKGASEIDSLQQAVQILASGDYMGTNPADGTGPGEVIEGIVRYVESAGYHVDDITYSGWRSISHLIPAARMSDTPDLSLIRSGLAKPSCIVLLNLGYYNRVSDGVWRRVTGHWVLATGYGTDGGAATDPSVLLVHNPARGMPKGLAPSTDLARRLPPDTARLSPMSGVIQNSRGQTIQSAIGMFSIEGLAIPKSRRYDGTVVDGIVAITLSPPSR